MNPSQPALPPPSTLTDPSVTPSTITDALDLLFEPSPSLHALAVPIIKDASAPLDTYADLIAAVEARLKALAAAGQTEQLDSILGSHPRLGEKKVDSALSRKEQAAMGQGGQDGQPQDNSIDFAALNAMYEQKFPGLRFVTFVNARPRDVIAVELRERVQRGDIVAERIAAIEAMCAIANDRARKLASSS